MVNRGIAAILGAAAWCGCAAALPSRAGPRASWTAPPAPVHLPVGRRCGTAGRERCDPEPQRDVALREKGARVCAEQCSKHWMQSSAAGAGASHPLERTSASLRRVQAELLSCFVLCERKKAEGVTAAADMPSGVELCVGSEPEPAGTACLEYACEQYGEQKLTMPFGIRSGERCELGAGAEPGSCVAGLCVSDGEKAEACSAYAVHALALERTHVLHEVWCARSIRGVRRARAPCRSRGAVPGSTRQQRAPEAGAQSRGLVARAR
jgi:hypothetical protein